MSFLVQRDIPLAPKTTLKTGGPAAYYADIISPQDLIEAVAFAEQLKLPFCVLGGGSNLLVDDQGYQGLVMHIKLKGVEYSEIDNETLEVTVAAGEVLDEIIKETVGRGLWGLENLSHIPGSVGATPVQNVGAYGAEVADVISTVTVFDTDTKKITTLNNADCLFSYRHSIFKEKNNLVILSVSFILSKQRNPKVTYADLSSRVPQEPTINDIRQIIISIRKEKFPDWTIVGTAGSFFKNPLLPPALVSDLLQKYPEIPHYPDVTGKVKISLGYVLDKICGLKGFSIGHVRLYEKQALVLVSEIGATSTDIKNFVKIISDVVFEKTGIEISQEVTEI